ncbi:hypothetical protein PV10_03233 [Exophiala mesophila]|uniref:Major facilitator superfamily (MFS) profile domain-containing protein n=1 Tax=Exophiala mesophila TaxID=212818 RepID=A0A0D1ZLW8_EXOME|nr:uncharacterized protein PV10_03233 [Exophiala mesophila]KIV95602.1 hypothetical protein PV10_03233 [Exophiala mesophila]
MAVPDQASVGNAARPSTDTTMSHVEPPQLADEEMNVADKEDTASPSESDSETESQRLMDVAWGRRGKLYMWIGIALIWTIFELDHATIYNYQNYAASDFGEVALLGALTTAGTIISAVLKPPIARISEVAGRAETYIAVVLFYIVSYILCASAQSFAQYAGGYVAYCIGQTGMQILNQVIVADITSSRWRGLANGLVNLPFMIIPWVSAFIVDSALLNIGWRWGIGMFAIIMPVASLAVIAPLLWYQRRFQRAGGTIHQSISFRDFLTQIDLGGMILLCGGCALLLLPIALAGNNSHGWKAPWIPALITIGVVSLAILVYYEARIAAKPVIPPRFVKNVSLVLAFLIGLLDAFAYSITHTYMYAWATVVHDFSARNATFLTYTAGCVQVLTGLATGYVMFRTKRYKFLLLLGIVIRLIGYGFMMRLRGANNSIAEIFLMQVIQGAGSGAVGTVVIVVAQVVVPREELAQSTALELLFIYMGNSLGSAIAGTIYTSLFKGRLRFWLGSDAPQSAIDDVYDKITEVLPDPRSPERTAVNHAYSDILRFMTIGALVASALPMVMIWFLPNYKLSDNHNLANDLSDSTQPATGEDDAEETTLKKWQRHIRW